MPTAPLKPCSADPTCPNRTPHGGPCPAHARQREQHRGSANARGYTWRWAQRRARFLAEYPLCGMRPGGRTPVLSRCHDEQRVTPATQVDHVVPHRGDRQLFDDPDNLQAMCAGCHARKSAVGQ